MTELVQQMSIFDRAASVTRFSDFPYAFRLHIIFIFFLQPHLQPIEVLGVELELRLLAYTTAHSNAILNPLSEARDQTRVPTETFLTR